MMRPVWDQIERPGAAHRVWQASQHRFASWMLGPHFEQTCREWALNYADHAVLGGVSAKVGSGTVYDPANQTSHEVDVAVIGVADGKTLLIAIGEAKWSAVMGRAHADRLVRIRDLLRASGRYDASATRLLCFSGAGFTSELQAMAAERDDIQLVGADILYGRA